MKLLSFLIFNPWCNIPFSSIIIGFYGSNHTSGGVASLSPIIANLKKVEKQYTEDLTNTCQIKQPKTVLGDYKQNEELGK